MWTLGCLIQARTATVAQAVYYIPVIIPDQRIRHFQCLCRPVEKGLGSVAFWLARLLSFKRPLL